jgi:3-dehydroquinate synthase class II
MADGSTKYLSELKAGDKILVVNILPSEMENERSINRTAGDGSADANAGVDIAQPVLPDDGTPTCTGGRDKDKGNVGVTDTVTVTSTREVAIGRLKVEPRPQVQISFASMISPSSPDIVTGQVFLQQAETVKLFARKSSTAATSTTTNNNISGASSSETETSPRQAGESLAGRNEDKNSFGSDNGGFVPVSVTAIKKGDAILVSFAGKGTHIGKRIDAKVTEK